VEVLDGDRGDAAGDPGGDERPRARGRVGQHGLEHRGRHRSQEPPVGRERSELATRAHRWCDDGFTSGAATGEVLDDARTRPHRDDLDVGAQRLDEMPGDDLRATEDVRLDVHHEPHGSATFDPRHGHRR